MFAKNRREVEKCACTEICLSNSHEKFWEGSAVLNHGSRIRFGCLDFVFIIVDYDFVSSRNLNNTQNIQPVASKFNHFYDIKNKKLTKKLKSSLDKSELKSIRDYESILQSNAASASNVTGSVKKSKSNSGKNLNKKLRKINSGLIERKKTSGSCNVSNAGGCAGAGHKRMMKKHKLEKIEAFLKLMNNTNKLSLLDST